ncbi:MAG: hypothetical protein JKY81_02165, partial [Colwellia sp.]|nr:hypothetical protein [Colwellia sp.]
IFTMQLDVQGLAYRTPPIEKTLQKIGVLGVMIKKYELVAQASLRTLAGIMMTSDIKTPVINKIIKKVIKNKKERTEVSYYWCEFNENVPLAQQQLIAGCPPEEVTSEYQLAGKIQQHKLIPLSHQATLAEAYLALVNERRGGVYIYQENVDDIIGMVTFEQIRQYLVNGKLITGVLPTTELARECVIEGKAK